MVWTGDDCCNKLLLVGLQLFACFGGCFARCGFVWCEFVGLVWFLLHSGFGVFLCVLDLCGVGII